MSTFQGSRGQFHPPVAGRCGGGGTGGRAAGERLTLRRAAARSAKALAEALEGRTLLAATSITSDFSPLSNITVSDVGNVQVSYAADGAEAKKYFYDNTFDETRPLSESGIFIRQTTANGSPVVYGSPLFYSSVPTPLVSAGPQVLADTGNRITTPLRTPDGAPSPLGIVQTVTYDGYSPYFRVENRVTNAGSSPATFDFFFAGDLNDRPSAVPFADLSRGVVGSFDNAGQQIFFQGDAPDHVQESFYADVWNAIGGGGDFSDTAGTETDVDDGMGLQWADRTLAAGETATYAYYVAFDDVSTGIPSASLTAGPLRNTNNNSTFTFRVDYQPDADSSSPSPIDASTLGDTDVVLRRTSDGAEFAAALVKVEPHESGDGGVTATYKVTRVEGYGDFAYRVRLRAGEVANAAGVSVPETTFDETIEAAKMQVFTSTQAPFLSNRLLAPNSGLTLQSTDLQGQRNLSDDGTTFKDVTTGFYSNPGGVYNLGADGIVLSTGDSIEYSTDTDGYADTSTEYNASPSTVDEDLLDQITGPADHYDTTSLTLTFTAAANVNQIFFNVAWGTTEPGGTTAGFDGFGIFLNGVNIAKTPDGSPINAANPNLAPVTGTPLPNVVAPNGDPALRFSPMIVPGSTNTLKIVIADTGNAAGDSTAFLSALTTKRTPLVPIDPGFGAEGQVAVNFVTESVAFSAAAGNKLYAVGRDAGNTRLVLSRLDDLGKLDPAFDGDGVANLALASRTAGYQVVPTADGGAIVVGESGGDVLVAKYTAAGVLDPAFGGGDGHVEIDFRDGGDDVGYGLTLDAAGRLVLVGRSVKSVANPRASAPGQPATVADSEFIVARLNAATGDLDGSFGTGGKVVVGFNDQDLVRDDRAGNVLVASGGRIVVAGYTDGRIGVVALTDAGGLDLGFGGGTGKRAFSDLNTTDQTVGLAAQSDGKLLVAGYARGDAYSKVGADFGLARLRADGSDDASFGKLNGLTVANLGGADDADGIVLTSGAAGDSIYVVGTSAVNTGGDNYQVKTAIARFTPNGADKSLTVAGVTGNTATYGGVGVVIPSATSTSSVTGLLDPGRFVPLAVGFPGVVNGNNNNKKASVTKNADGQPVVSGGGSGSSSTIMVIGLDIPALPGPPPPPPPPPPPSAVDPRTLRGSAEGTFGAGVDKKKKKLSFTDDDGTVVTMTLTGGSATYYFNADGSKTLNLDVTGTTAATALTVAAKGGDGRVRLGLINVMSPLKSFVAKTGDLTGTLFVNGPAGTVDIGSASGATLAVNGTMKALTVRGAMTSSTVLGGANLGSDGVAGSFDGSADAFAGSFITKVNVLGAMTNSHLGVGVNPGTDGTLGTADDQFVGGGGSTFKSMKVKGGADAASTFSVSGAFPKSVSMPGKVAPAGDERFKSPAAAATADVAVAATTADPAPFGPPAAGGSPLSGDLGADGSPLPSL